VAQKWLARQTHGSVRLSSHPLVGGLLASAILALWIMSLGLLLYLDKSQLSSIWILPFVFGRTFIQTGLFIVAHDAIHESVSPRYSQLNHGLGRLASTLYAFLSYQQLSRKHRQHHQYPGQVHDPDFHDGIHCNMFAWYLKFMRGYLDFRQSFFLLLGMGLVFVVFYFGFHVSPANLFLYWLLPIILSSIQLFLFGTYLPHRSNTTANAHHAVSSRFSVLWSFLSCYHFGYHWEHHEYPMVPWYQLPSMR
jgi:beta-carotene ketolase (CrtW type)